MRAEIRRLLTPDVDPETFVPTDLEQFMVLVDVVAGPADGPGEESFQFEVCTPGWLAELARRDGPVGGHGYVVVERFDWAALRAYFDRLVASCHGRDWPEIGARLSRHGHWEFA